MTFIIGAKGQTSNRTAQTTFTDASPGSLGNYATAGLSGPPTAPANVAPSNVAANVTFSNLTRGAGLSATPTANAFNSSSWQTTPTLTIAGNTDYYEFTITPNAGFQFSASELRVGLQKSSTGPDKAELRSSLDSFGSTIGSVITVTNSTVTYTINLSAVSGLQNRASAVTFRIYGYNASATGGTLRIERITSPAMVGLEVDGTVAAACTAPTISTNPSSLTKNVGESATFSVTASGTAPLNYQWRKGGVNISGATSSSYMIPSVVTGDAGSYDVVVTNACGSATSTAATLTVNKLNQTITFNALIDKTYGDADFNVSATASSGLTVSFAASGNCTVVGTLVHLTGAGNCTITASQAGNATYNAAPNVPQSFNINQKSLTPNITADNKVYDGNNSAMILTRSLSGHILTDDVSYTGGTATFDDKNAGTGKTVTATGLTLSGADAGNYTVNSTAVTTADINALAITGSITADNKVYDGSTSAMILTRTLTGVISGDDVSYVGGTATFDNKNVGTGKTVTATGLSLSGADAMNYSVNSSAMTTADITPRSLTVTASGINKIYDGNTNASVNLSTDKLSGDDVSASYTSALFADKNVGTGKAVSVLGISISGTDATNYALSNTTAATTADITPRTLTISATGINKVYDGNTDATVTLSDDRVSGDVLSTSYTSASFADKNVGTGKSVSVSGISFSGADAGNYISGNTTAATTADITARTLSVTATAANKTYDGNATASVSLSDDRIAGDVFTVSYTSATFDNKNVGMGKTVTVNGISISGTDAGNYSANTMTTATADITALAITGSITAANKTYDGNANAMILTRTLSGQILTDDVAYTGGTATFADKNVGNGKTVTATGLGLTGADAGNYTVNSTAMTTADITARTLTVSATGVNKIYDGGTNATVNFSDDRVSGDDVSIHYISVLFADKNVGTGKPVSVSGISIFGGADAGNYVLGNTTANTTADITQRTLNFTASGINKIYDGTTLAGVNLSNDRIAGDIFTTSYASAAFDTKNVGTGKTVTVNGISISGTDAGNYLLGNTSAMTTADITALGITGSITAASKTYDGNNSAMILTRTLSGQVLTDDVFYVGGTATFDDKNVGTGKTVTATGLSLSGADAGNYTVNSTAITTADITALPITGSITADNKVYDGLTSATILTRTLSGVVGGDDVSYVGGTANFADKNVGTAKTVTATGLSLSGADAMNYSVNSTAMTTADITARALTVSASGINKVYDGNADATVTLSDDRVSGDMLSTSYTSATFADKNVGTGKAVSVMGISISGADAMNYTFNTTAATVADITQKALTVSATGVNKVYDGTTDATVTLSDDRVSGDVFTTSYSSASFNNKTVGNGKPVNVSGISISGTDAGNYSFNTTAATTADITALGITGNITANNKVYDGNTMAMIATRTLTGVVSGDVVNYVGGTASFTDKNVGNGKTVNASGLSLSGADAGNYTVNSSASTTADITQRNLTISATAANKVFDGNTTASVTLSDNRVSGDVFTVSYTSADFDTPFVGINKPVTVSGISIAGVDAGNYAYNTTAMTTANISLLLATTTVTVSPTSQQYSDKVSFTATVSPGFAGMVAAASTVTFKVGTQTMGTANLTAGMGGTLTATLSDIPLLEPTPFGTSPTGQMAPTAPGTRTVTAVFGGVNSNFTVNDATTPLTITQENATANFSGATYFATANSTSKTANITLSTTVIDDNDGNRGDIRNAKVEFRLNSPVGTLLGGADLPVGLVNPADPTVGTATATNVSYTLSNTEFDAKGTTITVYTVVKNYYTTLISDPTTITISVPGTDGVTGGGHQILSMSNGQYAGTNGLKMNFGFTMKYGNSGRNLKGQANIIVRSNGRIYQIKSNAVDSLALIGTAYPKGATLTTKANMKDITNPLAPIDLGGNLRLQIDMTDAALGGQTDKVGITLFNADGGLFFSSHWDGIKTVQQLLGGGNISVR